jgi:hypothetical protein
MMRLFLRLRVLRDALKARVRKISLHRSYRVCGVLVSSLVLLVTAIPVHAQAPLDAIIQPLAGFAFQVAAIFTTAIVLIIDALVPVMTYNSFTNNAVVSAGWAIVRDTVNMFFVVVLIIIAFGTILGHERFKWQQQVPRLMLMALVINFSKTLCGIMIDFGQVIMLTFANALREIAAGNIIQLFGLNQLYSISNNASAMDGATTGSGGVGSSWDFLAAGILSVIMVAIVLVVLLGLVVVLLFRIVGLWVLVILAPMAWFAKGAEGIIESDLYKNWWGEFKCLVAIGPVLTFFLWLTLAVAGAGDIAVKSGFNVTSESNSADFISDGLQLKNFMSFLIGIILVFASFDAATTVCAQSKKAGGVMQKAMDPFKKVASGSFVKPGIAAGVAGGALGLKGASMAAPLLAKGGVKTAGLVAAGAKRMPGTKALRDARAKVTGGDELSRSEKLRKSADKHGNSAYGRWQAERKNKKADKLSQAAGSNVRDEEEKLKDKTRGQKTDSAKRLADMDGIPASVQGEAKGLAAYGDMIKDPQLQKDMGADRVEAMHNKYGDRYKKLNAHDTAKTGAINNFEKGNPQFIKDDTKRAEYLTNNIKSKDDVKGLSKEALKDSKVQEHLRGMESGQTTKSGERVSMSDWVAGGGIDAEKAKIIQRGDIGRVNVGGVVDGNLEAGRTDGVERFADDALRLGDHGTARNLLNDLQVKYKGADGAGKHNIASVMDKMGERLGGMKGDDAGETLALLNRNRESMTSDDGHGTAPDVLKSASPEQYVADNFTGASAERLASGTHDVKVQKVNKQHERATAMGKKDDLLRPVIDKAKNDLEAKRTQLSALMASVQKKADEKVNSTYGQRVEGDNLVNGLSPSSSRDEVEGAWELKREADVNHKKAVVASKTAVADNPEVAAMEAELGRLEDALNNINPEEIKGVKKLNKRITKLDQQIKKAEDTEKILMGRQIKPGSK